jgi:type II restriction enzyme
MQIPLGDAALGLPYASGSQRARVVTEAWIERNGYCLACESDRLLPTAANTQARDFECDRCGHAYELKSGKSAFRTRVVNGSFASMMRRIDNATVPSLLLLRYSSEWRVESLMAVHSAFITPAVIEKRKALSATARRAGWVGCNILLSGLPPECRIPLIANGLATPKDMSRRQFATIQPITRLSSLERGWAATTLRLIHNLRKATFTTEDAYSFESELNTIYPRNKNIRAKIRQQLQVLRDTGFLVFESRGVYRLASLAATPRP